ncbi:thioester dehydrase [Betaproteobacteria bacterium]|nr:thioester dehydrase [Betaproteobacteria bacterium]GHU43065.1 thioester dehydrase [Betaproteobacteria bacterium]
MTTRPYLPIEEYLPHRGQMLLLDRVLEVTPGRMMTSVSIRPESAFCREGRVAAYVGIEYMAQTVGALVGWHEREAGGAVKTGFLVSVRKYSCAVDYFFVGTTLNIEARENWRDAEGLGVMDCSIYHPDGKLLAEATLTAFQPENLHAYLNSHPKPETT